MTLPYALGSDFECLDAKFDEAAAARLAAAAEDRWAKSPSEVELAKAIAGALREIDRLKKLVETLLDPHE